MKANSQLIQKMNRLTVLNHVRRNPCVSRPAIAQSTGLSMASMTNITSYLIEKKLLAEDGTENAGRVGRKSTLLRFCSSAYRLICVYLDVNCINISYTDLEGGILNRSCINLENLGAEELLRIARENIIQFINQYTKRDILGISIAVSGIVLNGNQFVLSTSLKLKNVKLIASLERELEIPVFLDNVTLLRAIWCFCCSGHIQNQRPAEPNCPSEEIRLPSAKDNMIFIDLENGIGACQFFNGEINRYMLGEIGHTTVEKDGEPCFCGNRGCLEAMCSGDRIVRLYERLSGECGVTLDDVAKKHMNGSYAAHMAVNECAQYLGMGLANLVNLCKPSVIAINVGGFAPLRAVIEGAKLVMRERAYPALLEGIIIQEVSVGVDGTIAGSAFNMCDRLFDIAYPGSIIE